MQDALDPQLQGDAPDIAGATVRPRYHQRNVDLVGDLQLLEVLALPKHWAEKEELACRTGFDPNVLSMPKTASRLYPILNAAQAPEPLDLPEGRRFGACREALVRHLVDNLLARSPEYHAAHPISRTVNSQGSSRDCLGTLCCWASCFDASDRPMLAASHRPGMVADAYSYRIYTYAQEISATKAAKENGVTSADLDKGPTEAAIARLIALKAVEASADPDVPFDSDSRPSVESEGLYSLGKLYGVSSPSDKGLLAASLLVPEIYKFYFEQLTETERRLLGSTAIKQAITSATTVDEEGRHIYMSLESIGLTAESDKHVVFARLGHLGMQLLCANDYVAREMLLQIVKDCESRAPAL